MLSLCTPRTSTCYTAGSRVNGSFNGLPGGSSGHIPGPEEETRGGEKSSFEVQRVFKGQF